MTPFLWFMAGFVGGQLLVLVAVMVREELKVRQRNEEMAAWAAEKAKRAEREAK